MRQEGWKAAACVLASVLVASVLVSAGAAGSTTKKQRIAIEEKVTNTALAGSGTFTLTPLTSGPITADSGTFTYTGGSQGQVLRNGQTVTRYSGVDVLKGKHGTLRIPNSTAAVDAGGSYRVGTGTWSISGGTGAYASLRGGGRGAVGGPPQGTVFTRYEGYVSKR